MDRLIAFTEFDIFAYLIVGITALAACDLIFGSRLVFRTEWGFGVGTLVVVMAYVLGHLVSIPGDWALEEGLLKRGIGRPGDFLVRPLAQIPNPCPRRADPNWLQATLLGYWQPLSCEVQSKVRAQAPTESGDALFFKAYGVARNDMYARDRMLIFLRLYVFSRNMACVAFIAALAVLLVPVWRRAFASAAEGRSAADIAAALPIHRQFPWVPGPAILALIFFVLGLGLFYRYMLFFRLYSIEVFIAYASAPVPLS